MRFKRSQCTASYIYIVKISAGNLITSTKKKLTNKQNQTDPNKSDRKYINENHLRKCKKKYYKINADL